MTDNTNWVSIHVPLAEHDKAGSVAIMRVTVSIHVPLAEHDPVLIMPV